MLAPTIREDFLYYVWKTKSFDPTSLKSTDDHNIEIIDFGFHNHNAGPDFSNAKISIDGTVWAGSVEMHVFSSDWYKHSHDLDKAYDAVILHVVYEHDEEVIDTNGRKIVTIALKDRIDPFLFEDYLRLMNSNLWIPCANNISTVPPIVTTLWLSRIGIERLHNKTKVIADLHQESVNNWDQTFYLLLSKYFGGKVNRIPFEMLARSLPYEIILKNIDQPTAIDALLFGQAGMLDGNFEDPYFIELKAEYTFFKKKYSLKSIPSVTWKFSKMRPVNFPTLRIAQLSSFLQKHPRPFSLLLEHKDLNDLYDIHIHSYWDTHYRFGKESKFLKKNIGTTFKHIITINVIAPILFHYGHSIQSQDIKDRAVEVLENIPSEKNSILNQWKTLGVKPKNALDSQALLELKTNYCNQKKCMSCNIGNFILKK